MTQQELREKKEAGYVELADDQSLPDIENYCQSIQGVTDYSGRMSGYRIGQQDMLKQGWQRVKGTNKV